VFSYKNQRRLVSITYSYSLGLNNHRPLCLVGREKERKNSWSYGKIPWKEMSAQPEELSDSAGRGLTRKGSCSCLETPSTFSYHHYAHDHVDSAVLDHMVKMPASHRTPSCWEPISFGDGGTELASPWSAVLSPACATASGSCWHQGYRRKEAVACRRSRGVASRLPHHGTTSPPPSGVRVQRP
jgi:hypothetical protein